MKSILNISGRLTSDANINSKVAFINLAINKSYKNKNDEWVKKTHYVNNIAVFDLEKAKNLKKGDLVIIYGNICNTSYIKDCKTIYITSITASQVYKINESSEKKVRTSININKAHAIGRIGKKPYRFGDGGISFDIAINTFHNGEKQTKWISIIAFNKIADNVEKVLSVGNLVEINGEFQYSVKNQKQGAVILRSFQKFSSKNDQKNDDEISDNSEYSDDVPF